MGLPPAPATPPVVQFRDVVKRFGASAAVDGVNLEIRAGEFLVLVGPSGCGKTTLLRMLAGFEVPTSGEVFIAGENMTEVPPHRRPVNMMFQSYALFPHMSVERNIAFGLVMDRVSKPEIARRVVEMLDLVQLAPFARRMPHQLSGGQRQRVALARALARRPKVLLLDEPLSALDKKLREETRLELTKLQVRLGITFVMVTHDQEEAMAVADRIGVMTAGRLVQVAPPAEIYEQPNSRYVASFIGDINLFECTVAERRGAAVVLRNAALGVIRTDAATRSKPGETVWFAIRPEKIGVLSSAPGDAASALAGEVAEIGYVGDRSTYHVRLASGAVLRAVVANSRRAVERPIGRGSRVWLSWTPRDGVLLSD